MPEGSEGQQPTPGELQARAAERILQDAQRNEAPKESPEAQMHRELTKNAQELQRNMAAFSDFAPDTPVSQDSAAKLDKVGEAMQSHKGVRKFILGSMAVGAVLAEASN